MQIYLVGGAIRDRLLGLPTPYEQDWVVVNGTPDELINKGYIKVGKSFPVFIDSESGEEYALARTERKSGEGYHGFEFDAGPHVTLKEDLSRRDLTINAIAQDHDGALHDPFNGQKDIENKISENNILISAHGNSIRALCKYLFKLDENQISKLEIPTGNPLLITLDGNKKITDCKYLDDERAKDLVVF